MRCWRGCECVGRDMQDGYLSKVLGFAERIGARRTLNSAAGDLADLAADYGFSTYVLATFSGPGSLEDPYVLSTGWDPEWQKRYLSKNYVLHDPVVARATFSAVPFIWSETRSDSNVTTRGLRILDEASEFQMQDGVFVPIHSPKGLIGSLTLGGYDAKLGADDLRALHLAGLCAYNHLLELAKPDFPDAEPEQFLTKREIECLKWTAAGKTSAEIADRLDISRHTADWYLKEAMRKLGAANRTHAVALAFRFGIIG